MLKAKLQSLRTCRGQMPEDEDETEDNMSIVEAEVEDKISASRTVWPRGLNTTGCSQ